MNNQYQYNSMSAGGGGMNRNWQQPQSQPGPFQSVPQHNNYFAPSQDCGNPQPPNQQN